MRHGLKCISQLSVYLVLVFLLLTGCTSNKYNQLQETIISYGYSNVLVDKKLPFDKAFEKVITDMRSGSSREKANDVINLIVEFQMTQIIADTFRTMTIYGQDYRQSYGNINWVYGLIDIAAQNADITDCLVTLEELCKSAKYDELSKISAMLYVHTNSPEHFMMYSFDSFLLEDFPIISGAHDDIKKVLLETPIESITKYLFVNVNSIDRSVFQPTSPINGCYIRTETHDEYPDNMYSITDMSSEYGRDNDILYSASYLDNVSN